jgi:hypothetical protein
MGAYNDMIAPGGLEHIGDEFRRNWGTRFVFLILSGIGETGYNCRYTPGGGRATGVYHDEQLH